MNIPILKFKVTDIHEIEIEIPRRIFKNKKEIKIIEESYIISLEYDLDEDRFYYIDGKKSIPTKKDLSRSIIMIYDIYKRYEKFGKKDNFTLYEDKLGEFLDNFFKGSEYEDEEYLSKMIFGTQPIKLIGLNCLCEELGISDVNFNKYYYIQYPVTFR